jgi:hypothetical protein
VSGEGTAVETLREAARLMRERAQAAQAIADVIGDWWSDEGLRDAFAAVTGDVDVPMTGAAEDAAHIASWHPAVALAVADWLDLVADGLTELDVRTLPGDRALAVARAYLGSGS